MFFLFKSNQELIVVVVVLVVVLSSSILLFSVEFLVELDVVFVMLFLDFYLLLEDGLFWGQCLSSYIILDFNMLIQFI